MSELYGLELRKALCEALGWDVIPVAFCENEYQRENGIGMPRGSATTEALPRFESDPGVFWPEFEKWRCSFVVNKPGFRLVDECGNDLEPYYQFTIEAWVPDVLTVGDHGWRELRSTSAMSICEAGCRAWLLAMKVR